MQAAERPLGGGLSLAVTHSHSSPPRIYWTLWLLEVVSGGLSGTFSKVDRHALRSQERGWQLRGAGLGLRALRGGGQSGPGRRSGFDVRKRRQGLLMRTGKQAGARASTACLPGDPGIGGAGTQARPHAGCPGHLDGTEHSSRLGDAGRGEEARVPAGPPPALAPHGGAALVCRHSARVPSGISAGASPTPRLPQRPDRALRGLTVS